MLFRFTESEACECSKDTNVFTVCSSNSHDLMPASIPKIMGSSCKLLHSNRWICWRVVKLPNGSGSLSKPRTKTKAAAGWVGARSSIKLLKNLATFPNSGTQTIPCVVQITKGLLQTLQTLAPRQLHVLEVCQVKPLNTLLHTDGPICGT